MALGEVAEAEEHFRAGIRQAWELGTLPLSLWAVAGLGWVRARAGDSRTALAWLGLALSHPGKTVCHRVEGGPRDRDIVQ